MIMPHYYLVPTSTLAVLATGPYVHYESLSVPPDHAQHLVWINWQREDGDVRDLFEMRPEVVALGDPWTPVPSAALAPLQALQDQENQRRRGKGVSVLPSAATPGESVAAVLRKAAPRHRPEAR